MRILTEQEIKDLAPEVFEESLDNSAYTRDVRSLREYPAVGKMGSPENPFENPSVIEPTVRASISDRK